MSSTAFDALRARRSHSKVTEDAPDHKELERLLSAMSSIADHSGLRPWRIIELRGDARRRLGEGLAHAAAQAARKESGSGTGLADPKDIEKYVSKATRAPLVLAIIVSPKPSHKVPLWEQEAVASGVAHALGLLLHEAGWGSIWRTGPLTRTKAVRKAHGIKKPEYLLGWLYVGGIPDRDKVSKPRKPLDVSHHLSSL
ncbi:nitroreductase [Leucobacter coleopterorum]|uniref:Putative NAD(P)H nitroreductase n=1 Tax=Leucobacter coleopterorum TaxID=2714933 RepID=A0ABX6K291_9MICO|nr:nitroreductase [Leucobacter coleopterorum]QIM19260.1 nitroreductase [Leucobacter coleopterorum]